MTATAATPPLLIFVIGCPGAGKGTLCRLLSTQYCGSHLSVGDLLRSKIALTTDREVDTEEDRYEVVKNENKAREEENGIETKAALADYIRDGTLVPTDMLLALLKAEVELCMRDGKTKFVLVDGFPRVLAQGVEVENVIGAPDLVLFFDCGKEIAAERFRTRKLPGRLDDDMAMFEKRYEEFERLNGEIVTYYRGLGKLVEIDSRGETEASYGRLLEALDGRDKWMELKFISGSR